MNYMDGLSEDQKAILTAPSKHLRELYSFRDEYRKIHPSADMEEILEAYSTSR